MSFLAARNAIAIDLGGIIAFATNPLGASVNLFAGAAAAYSTRIPAGSPYNGPLLRVRRGVDNAEADFGAALTADANGNRWLDTTALLAFCGAGSGFVTTWYDQSVNARHATQTTASFQPRIVNAGVVDVVNGAPALLFNNSKLKSAVALVVSAVPWTAAAVIKQASTSGNQMLLYSSQNTTLEFGLSKWLIYAGSALNASTTGDTNAHTLSAYYNASASRIVIDGTQTAFGNTGSNLPNLVCIGQRDDAVNAPFAGYLPEMVITTAVTSNQQLTTLNRSQGAAFGITVA